ncbi:protein GRAVITROPIC IN THE LIGHT 1-like isoform X2 [Rhododendron vialii]|uniref:protein GRAVITROPIC IN THE LIGHT 1-like isoform X2 n=1 Tax=Rhododendron vialii TaxID=182163 RepID=UPI00265E7B2C|nr:protein GRAVITROPIC IN THE LIGHT 1-like isoform X2 [Rhododendron vialii]
MDAVDRRAVTPNKSLLARTFAKVLNVRAATGVAPDDGAQKTKTQETVKHDSMSNRRQSFGNDEKLRHKSSERRQSFGFGNDEKLRHKSSERRQSFGFGNDEKLRHRSSERRQSFGNDDEKLRHKSSDMRQSFGDNNEKPRHKSSDRCQSFGDNDEKLQHKIGNRHQSFDNVDEKLQHKLATEAFLAKLFASVSTLKAAYAQMQFAESPYDGEAIQAADQIVVSELKNLSGFKQSYVKKQFYESSPEKVQVLAELQEQKSLLKTYEIMGKKLDSQLRFKNSEIIFLKEKLEETKKENRLIERRLNASGLLSNPDNLQFSGLNPNHFISAVRQTVKSVRQFARLMINEMELTGWDLDSAARAIEPDVVYWDESHKCFAIEAFVCREMFDGFNFPHFIPPNKWEQPKKQHRLFFDRFTQLKAFKTREYLVKNPKSKFATFCSAKFFRVVHPKMESSLFGNTNHTNVLRTGEFPDTSFFYAFSDMAKRVWLLHCLAFSFEPEASIFEVKKRCRFSEVYMESVCEEAFLSSDGKTKTETKTGPVVAFTVVPGFRIGKTVIQCQVYLS